MGENSVSRELRKARLVVRNDLISSEPNEQRDPLGFLSFRSDEKAGMSEEVISQTLSEFQSLNTQPGGQPRDFRDVVSGIDPPQLWDTFTRALTSTASSYNFGGRTASISLGGRLHKGVSLHKGLHKGLHKSLHKGLHKNAGVSSNTTSSFGNALLEWPQILPPWVELGRLYDLREEFRWDKFDVDGFLEKPRSPEDQLLETLDVLTKQEVLRRGESAWRRSRIEVEATNDISAYMTPLGTNVSAPSSDTAVLFQMILWLGNVIGLYYKERFEAQRPHVINPNIEPYLPVPAFYSYPSNHAFQSYLIAEVFARAVPEHSGLLALYRAAGQVGLNREYAGLHIRSDTKAGQRLARLCAPVMEKILEEQILRVRREWY